MHDQPAPEHAWLQKLVGEWTTEGECSTGPDLPPMKYSGTESVRSLGGFWALAEGTGDVPGGSPSTSIMSIGYSPARKKYVGTFIASMMAHVWIYEGDLDAAGKVLTLNTEGPSMAAPGTTAPYKDVIEFVTDDHRTLSSHTPGPDGTWAEFMRAHYRRVKP